MSANDRLGSPKIQRSNRIWIKNFASQNHISPDHRDEPCRSKRRPWTGKVRMIAECCHYRVAVYSRAVADEERFVAVRFEPISGRENGIRLKRHRNA
jgi:hypothetical protein